VTASAVAATVRDAEAGLILDLDRAATSPVHPDVLSAMLPYFSELAGNPASVHALGRRARHAVEEARERVAAAVGVRARQVVFTSGATEALHLAILGSLAARPGAHVVAAASEHAAVIEALRSAERRGHPVTWLAPDAAGRIDPAALVAAVSEATALVVVMRTNNETGVQHDLSPWYERLTEHGARVVVDAVQAFGYEPLSLDLAGADLMALSSHKVAGPKGCGALILREGIEVEPQQRGGGQERGLRGGTVDVPAVVGFGVAAQRAARADVRGARVAALRDRFEQALVGDPSVTVNGAAAPRGPKHSNLHFAGVDGETLLINLDTLGVMASAGSACAAGSLSASHVLVSMGRSVAEARQSIRFSFGEELSEQHVDVAIERVRRALQSSR